MQIESDIVVHGRDRVRNIDDLNLEAAAVEYTPRGIKVNHYLQSVSNAAVYAIGDCADSGAPRLTPVAGYEGRTAVNLQYSSTEVVRYKAIPTSAFTIPALAAVGVDGILRVASKRASLDTKF
jgi:glutathione reductase (NADPH)